MLSRFLDQLERRYGRHRGIRNLATIIVMGAAALFVVDYLLVLFTDMPSLSSRFCFDKMRIMRGEIWRMVTFVFVPTMGNNLIVTALGLYMVWLMGNMLQSYWGTFRFTIFYIVGWVGTVVAGLVSGYATAHYLNLSMMLAMACIQPDLKLSLYGVLDIRLKWIALLALAGMMLPFISVRDWSELALLLVSLINVVLFFADKLIGSLRQTIRHQRWKRNWRNSWRP